MRITLYTLAAVMALGFAAAPPAKAQQRDSGQLLLRADLNGDGRITRAEYTQAREQLFDRLDRNKDGVVDQSDAPRGLLRRRAGGERLSQLREYMDTNGDGRVTREEFVNGPTPMFDRADANGDGVIDQAELAAFRKAAAARNPR